MSGRISPRRGSQCESRICCHYCVETVSKRLLVLSVAAYALLSLTACSSTPTPTGDPDPGHQRLTALKPVLTAIPPNATVQYKLVSEPKWDSCDGRRSTFGWNDLSVDAAFTTASTVSSVWSAIRNAMASLGWASANSQPSGDPPGLSWTRVLPGGATAEANLTARPDNPRGWTLHAEAPPAVRPATGC